MAFKIQIILPRSIRIIFQITLADIIQDGIIPRLSRGRGGGCEVGVGVCVINKVISLEFVPKKAIEINVEWRVWSRSLDKEVGGMWWRVKWGLG